MIEIDPPAAPQQRAWIVRMIGPRPAPTIPLQLAEVLRRTFWILPLEFLAAALLSATGLSAGNAGAEEIEALLRGNAAYSLLVACLVGPVLEESLFRGLPSWISNLALRRKQGSRWVLGLSMAAAFALLHNLKSKAGEHSVELIFGFHLDTSVVPVTQFVFGLLLWDLVRRHGWWACTLSHMLHNLILVGPALLFLESTQ